MTTKVCVVYDSLNPGGGAENLTVSLTSVLANNLNCEVMLYLIEKPRIEFCREYLPHLEHAKIQSLPLGSFFGFLRYGRTAVSMCNQFYAKLKRRYDVIVNTTGISSPLGLFGDIVYVHYPFFDLDFLNSRKVVRRAYGFALEALGSSVGQGLMKKNGHTQLILANSHFTLSLLRELELLSQCETQVLYPPVDVKSIVKRISFNSERKDVILTVSRFSKERNLILIPSIAKELEHLQFIISGRIRDKRYFKRILKAIDDYRISNLKILPNLGRGAIFELLQEGKVYLNTMLFEPFGISVVEGMAAGLIPIVSDSGGPREYVPKEWRYHGMEGISDKIQDAISASNDQVIRDMSNRALEFDAKEFEIKAEELLRHIL